MILVITNQRDYSVKEVLEWLHYFNEPFIRINHEKDTIDIDNICLSSKLKTNHPSVKLKIKNEVSIALNDLKNVWYRGGSIKISHFLHNEKAVKNRIDFKDNVFYYLSAYSFSKLEATQIFLNMVFHLGNNAQGRFNKIFALYSAVSAGLCIPSSIYTTSKSELIEFYLKNNKTIITKSLDLNFECNEPENNMRYYQYTSIVTSEFIENAPDKFPLTLFQEKIEKRYEIRTFFIGDSFYSVAIMSQFNKKTQVDYRQYDYQKMNRIIPYKLPEDIEEKLKALTKSCNLNTGSIDIIRSMDNQFVFLEVNPIGQFGYNSRICNLYLEQKIAKFLQNSGINEIY